MVTTEEAQTCFNENDCKLRTPEEHTGASYWSVKRPKLNRVWYQPVVHGFSVMYKFQYINYSGNYSGLILLKKYFDNDTVGKEFIWYN